MMYSIKCENSDELFTPFATKLYCLILIFPPAPWLQKFMKCAVVWPSLNSWQLAIKAPLSTLLLFHLTYLSCSLVRDYHHMRRALEHKLAQQESEAEYNLCLIYINVSYALKPYDIKSLSGFSSWEPVLIFLLTFFRVQLGM